ncbi:class I SAM-dependent methyltransferase [Pengzhenrongella sp.]|uniref:class I SAM-dependent methyltransferase n=1 Tax=Pengzhenrongella sp. TaxID=2888820 RepID=UPI0039C8EBE1
MTPPISYLLFPGRHHFVTAFQVAYLQAALRGEVRDADELPVACDDGAQVVWALTSSTHSGTRRNPVPAHRREAMIEAVTCVEGIPSLVAPIADVPDSDRFAGNVLLSVALTTGARLTPANSAVACSTPAVAAQYAELGFRVLRVEDGHPDNPPRPWDILELMVADDPSWRTLAHPQAAAFYDRYALAAAVRLIHTDPTVSSEGDLTTTRDYRSYTAAFDDASDRKWEQLAAFIQPGRVVDLGCAAGGLLERASTDPRLGESDLFGVDVSRHLIAEAEHRRAQGVFANPNVFFAQRNLLRAPVFPAASVNSTITVALTHEISSYGAGRVDLELLASRIFEHTAPGGVWVNSDVVGPVGGDRLVHLSLAGGTDADAVDYTGWAHDAVTAHFRALRPADQLRQFARDFPALSGGRCPVRWVSPDVAELPLRSAMEFLYTRDYDDNYLSECHERFCDMSYPDWVALLTGAGFTVDVC